MKGAWKVPVPKKGHGKRKLQQWGNRPHGWKTRISPHTIFGGGEGKRMVPKKEEELLGPSANDKVKKHRGSGKTQTTRTGNAIPERNKNEGGVIHT